MDRRFSYWMCSFIQLLMYFHTIYQIPLRWGSQSRDCCCCWETSGRAGTSHTHSAADEAFASHRGQRWPWRGSSPALHDIIGSIMIMNKGVFLNNTVEAVQWWRQCWQINILIAYSTSSSLDLSKIVHGSILVMLSIRKYSEYCFS